MNTGLRISVCMAAWNGEAFIGEQLDSILRQLSVEDEVIVVDDASTDGTRDRIRELADPRIRLFVHSETQGVVRTFEEAIRRAANQLIFLSDQDDLWLPGKAAAISRIFAARPEVTLVVSGVAPIDSTGNPLPGEQAPRRRFRPGLTANLIHNQYQGCAMAFRSDIRPEIVPFPYRYDVLHDIWIGVRNHLAHGTTVYIDEPLVLYRRHARTVTGRKKLSLSRRLRMRLHLLFALAVYSWHRKARGGTEPRP